MLDEITHVFVGKLILKLLRISPLNLKVFSLFFSTLYQLLQKGSIIYTEKRISDREI